MRSYYKKTHGTLRNCTEFSAGYHSRMQVAAVVYEQAAAAIVLLVHGREMFIILFTSVILSLEICTSTRCVYKLRFQSLMPTTFSPTAQIRSRKAGTTRSSVNAVSCKKLNVEPVRPRLSSNIKIESFRRSFAVTGLYSAGQQCCLRGFKKWRKVVNMTAF